MHKNMKWIKVGHTTDDKPFMRLLRGGFNSNICPDELKNKLYHTDVTLAYWFPNLNISIEKELHKKFKSSGVGEFYRIDLLGKILNYLYANGGNPKSDFFKNYNEFLRENERFENEVWCHGEPWSEDLDSRLIRFLNNDVPIENIAKFMGRTEGAIKSRVDKICE